MGALLRVEHSMPEGRPELFASAVPCIILCHGFVERTGRGQMKSASQQTNPDVSAISMFAGSGPRIRRRSLSCSTVETFEYLNLRVAVCYATCTHVDLYWLKDTQAEKKSVRNNSSRIFVPVKGYVLDRRPRCNSESATFWEAGCIAAGRSAGQGRVSTP